ncbi:MAG: fatty acid desaturase CarF family protein [Patescibacteria group bacterium]
MQGNKWIRRLDGASIVLFGIYLVMLFRDVATIASSSTVDLSTTLIVFSVILGYLLADFLSGFVHFLGDTFGSATTPIVGPAFIFPFREHHRDPEDITRHDFIDTNGHNCLVSLPVMMFMTHVLYQFAITSTLFAFTYTTLLFLILGIFLTNQFHKWAHMPVPPSFITPFQRARLILSPAHHKRHHNNPFDTYYCITTGWLNLLLERTRFFRAAKATIRRIPFMLKTAEEYPERT